MRWSLLASVGVLEFHTTEAYSDLDLTNVTHYIMWVFGQDKESVTTEMPGKMYHQNDSENGDWTE